MLGVAPIRLLKGCSSIQGDENLAFFKSNCLDVMPLEDMLSRQFRTDAHFFSYQLTDFPKWPRLNKSILPELRQDGYDVVLAYLTFDWDNPNHSGWTEEWLGKFSTLIGTCTDPIISAWSALYTSANGARIIYKMSQTVPVDEAEKHIAWMFDHFQKNGFGENSGFGQIDNNCKDWTRCMRCPQVIRDGKPTWEQDYYSIMTKEGVLDMNLVGKRSTKTIARKTYFNREKQEQPTFEQLDAFRHAKDRSTQREKQTEFYKRAKKALKDSIYLDILFNDAAPVWDKGRRNDEIVKMLGYIIPVLLKSTGASAPQIFSLAISPLLTLDNDQDWIAHGWNALLDIYEREVHKGNLEKEEVAKQASLELDYLDTMVEGMTEWCSSEELRKDEDSAREFVKSNCIVTVQKYLYLIQENGRYLDFPLGKDQLISRIRSTSLKHIIDTSKTNQLGEVVDINPLTILNQHSTAVAEIHMKPVGIDGGCISNINGEKPVMVLSTFCRNDKLEPTFNPFVDQWLVNLFGEHYEKGCEWIANALAFEEGLICAFSMEGAASTGKKLFTEGLSECLKVPYIAGPEAMYQQSPAFLRTPFLVVNEAWPKDRGTTPADKFKSLTGGDGIVVNEKFKPQVRVLCPVRIIMTANDNGIIRELISGKNMGVHNRIAVGERLYHIKISNRAELYLKSIGGRGFTAKKGQRWIRPDSGSDSSNFVVAKHFLWLYNNRGPVDSSQRFLVMGNCAPGAAVGKQTVIERLLADNNHTPVVAQAIISLADCRTGSWTQYIRTDTEFTKLWVTRYGVCRYIKEAMEERVRDQEVFSAMQNLLAKPDPDKFDNVNWYEISVETLALIATERGIPQTYVRTIYMNSVQKGLIKA